MCKSPMKYQMEIVFYFIPEQSNHRQWNNFYPYLNYLYICSTSEAVIANGNWKYECTLWEVPMYMERNRARREIEEK